MRRCREKAREFMSADRLLEDKNYLVMLAGGIGVRTDLADDTVEKDITDEAMSVLKFLQVREEFWTQIDVGKNRSKFNRNKRSKLKQNEANLKVLPKSQGPWC